MRKILLHQPDQQRSLKYVIIGARYRGQWIFVRHKDRSSWELPAGHIESGEEPMDAARRELYEETGAVEYELFEIGDYSVSDTPEVFGRLFAANVQRLAPLPDFEIAEIIFSEQLPPKRTYPELQPLFFEIIRSYRP